MLERLDGRFRLLQHEGPAAPEELSAFTSYFQDVPAEYLELVGEATEIELEWDGGYVRIWGPAGCLEMAEAYDVAKRIPGALPIGDNGGGAMLVYMDGNSGPGLYRVSYGDIDREDATRISPTLLDLLARGTGVEAFK